jgi:hypothetical protein
LATEWHVDVQDSQGLNVSMDDRVRRKLNAMGFVNQKGEERGTDVMFKAFRGVDRVSILDKTVSAKRGCHLQLNRRIAWGVSPR